MLQPIAGIGQYYVVPQESLTGSPLSALPIGLVMSVHLLIRIPVLRPLSDSVAYKISRSSIFFRSASVTLFDPFNNDQDTLFLSDATVVINA